MNTAIPTRKRSFQHLRQTSAILGSFLDFARWIILKSLHRLLGDKVFFFLKKTLRPGFIVFYYYYYYLLILENSGQLLAWVLEIIDSDFRVLDAKLITSIMTLYLTGCA